jgi:hypothetical protein
MIPVKGRVTDADTVKNLHGYKLGTFHFRLKQAPPIYIRNLGLLSGACLKAGGNVLCAGIDST